MCNFDELAESAGTCRDLEAIRHLAIGIEILGEAFCKKATSVYTTGSLLRAVEKLEKFAGDTTIGSYVGYFGERGWSRERTVSQILEKAKAFVETAMRKAFMTHEGDWPTPADSWDYQSG